MAEQVKTCAFYQGPCSVFPQLIRIKLLACQRLRIRLLVTNYQPSTSWHFLPCLALPNFLIFLTLNLKKKKIPMKLLRLITYFGPIEVTKFLSFISEGVISLSLLSTLSVHFRNQSIISIMFEANQKMC